MEETKKLKKMTVLMGENRYELDGGGDGGIVPGVPIPHDTVDSAAIIDGSVEMADLNDNVKDVMLTDSDRVTQEDLDTFEV